jgi:hypothetical protein
MIFFATSSKWTRACAAVIGLGACQMVNPAFEDEGQADEVGDEVDTTAGESTVGESGESGSSSESTDASTDASGTTDPSDAPDTDFTDDTIEPDLPVVEECLATFSDPFRPIYGTAEAFGGACPFAVNEQYVKVLGNGPAIGLLDVQPCAQGCSSCLGESRPLGVIGLEEFTVPLVTLLQNQPIVCLTIQTGSFRHVDELGCLYDSLWVGTDGNPGIHLLLAMHRVSWLPVNGTALLGGKQVVLGDTLEQCSCEGVYEDPADFESLQCCLDSPGEPFVSSLSFLETPVAPGTSANVGLDGGEWGFHVAQAQQLPTCENNFNLTVDMSWALVRGQ